MFEEVLTRLTIQAALAAYFLALALPKPNALAKRLWALGALLSWLHIAAAMIYVHHGSHAEAVEETARRTEALFGWRFGGGVYFNYVFAALWTADALWWWLAPAAYQHRPRWVAWTIHGYLLFIVINGAIVFASGPTRWLSLAALVIVGGILLLQKRAKQSAL
jgi:hypothetical protein